MFVYGRITFLFIIEVEFLQIQDDCSLIIMFFVLMLVETCCFILSASPCVVRPIIPSFTSALKFVNYSIVLSGRNIIFLADGSMTLVL